MHDAPHHASRARQTNGRRPDIQGLRALAVLLVVANHLVNRPRGGFIGVDVFFVISGYLITGLLVRENARSGAISLREFYARRLRRIMPVAVVVLLTTNVLALQVFSPLRVRQTQVDSLWAALFGANLRFSALGTDYFQQRRPPSAVQHFWSLSVEEQFYAFWPVLLILAFLLTRRLRLGARTLVLPLALVGSAASFAWCVHLTSVNQSAAYFSTAARAWELGLGAILALTQGRLSRLPSTLRALASWLGLAGILVAAVTFDDTTAFPGSAALLPVLAVGLLLAADDPDRGVGKVGLLNSRIPQYVGNISYSLYLWHFPCIILAVGYFAGKSPSYYLVAGLAPLALSIASYHLVEDPIRSSTWLSRKPDGHRRRSVATWQRDNATTLTRLLAGLAVVVLAGVAVVLQAPHSPANDSRTAPRDGPLTPAAVVEALRATDWGQLVPSPETLNDAVAPQWRPDNCLYIENQQDSRRCTYGSPTGRRTVAIIGDSVAASWMPGLLKAFPQWRFQMLTRGECPAVDSPTFQNNSLKSVPNDACTTHRRWVLRQLAAMKPDLVIDSGLSEVYVNLMVDGSADQARNQLRWQQATERTFRAVRAATAGPVFFLGAPPEGISLQNCYQPRSHPQDCVQTLSRAWSQTSGSERRAAASTGVTYVDPLPWLCADSRCPSTINQRVVYADGTHLTREMSELLAPYLRARLSLP